MDASYFSKNRPYLSSYLTPGCSPSIFHASKVLKFGALLAFASLILIAAPFAKAEVDCLGLYSWNDETSYPSGTNVYHETERYEANWWSQGNEPSTHSGLWQEWSNLGRCSIVPKGSDCTGLPQWDANVVYLGGDEVERNDKHYRAEWWTQGFDPVDATTPWDAWSLLDHCRAPSGGGEPIGEVWVADAGGVHRIENGQVVQTFPVLNSVFSVSKGGDYVWVYHQQQLRQYSASGALTALTTLPGSPHSIALNFLELDSTGVWLAEDQTLYRLDLTGQLLNVLEIDEPVIDLVQGDEDFLWLATSSELLVIRNDGQIVDQMPMSTPVRQLAYVKDINRIWVLTDSSLLGINSQTREESFRSSFTSSSQLAPGKDGALWVIQSGELLQVSSDGEIVNTIEVHSPVKDIGFDSEAGGVWLAVEEYLHFYDSDGQLQYTFLADGVITQIITKGVAPPFKLSFLEPRADEYIKTNAPDVRMEYSGSKVLDASKVDLIYKDISLSPQCIINEAATISCELLTPLPEGEVTLKATINDEEDANSPSASVTFSVDTISPTISLISPESDLVTNSPSQILTGAVSEPLQMLRVNDVEVSVNKEPDGSYSFEQEVALEEGVNIFSIIAVDLAGNDNAASYELVLDTTSPSAPDTTKITVQRGNDDDILRIEGKRGSVEPNSLITLTNIRSRESVTVYADADGAFSVLLSGRPEDGINTFSTDRAGNSSGASLINFSELPPDPSLVAPPLSSVGVTPFLEANEFLYSGGNPIQTGVAPGAVEARRAAVVRGRVLDRQGEPLSGTYITVKDHSELGQTISRADGRFDIVVNGGGYLTLNYEKEGYLPAQRKVKAPWRDYASLSDVVLIPLDEKVTAIDLSVEQMQFAQGSVQSDSAGERQFTMLFPSGTTATMTLSDGSVQELTSLNVRATEYTVGENGLKAMPGELPATSGYTYAVELSVDQALNAGAERVDFSQPIPTYVDNFLSFPTGEVVPLGYYDRKKSAWIGSNNGRVVEILAIEAGQAVLDVSGEGVAATEEQLNAMNISGPELQQLAQLYTEGQSFWRAPIPHFTPWDHNWPVGPPSGAEEPDISEPEEESEKEPEDSDEECQKKGCIISAQAQSLGERIDLVGTPLDLVYQSSRAEDFKVNRTDIMITNADAVEGVKEIRLTVQIAGRTITRTFSGEPNQNFTFEWDGKDAFGRMMMGEQLARIQISYIYPCVYYSASDSFVRAWASIGNPDRVIGVRGENCDGFAYDRVFSRELMSPSRPQPNSANKWSLSNHHTYDISSDILYLGTGAQRPVSPGFSINYVAGTTTNEFDNRQWGYAGDGGPAVEALLDDPLHMAFDPVGNLYIVDRDNNRIRKVNVDGVITTFAGTGEAGFSGDGGAASAAQLMYPRSVAVGPNGEVYIADYGNSRIRKVDTNGIISTVVGNGEECPRRSTGDWSGPAINVPICGIGGLAFDREGNLYFGHSGFSNKSRVYKVDTSGFISVFAGTGRSYSNGDGGPAIEADIEYPADVAFDSMGNLYIMTAKRVRKVSPDGIIWTIAGDGTFDSSNDEGLAIYSGLDYASAIAFDADDNLYISLLREHRIRKVKPNGLITSFAGSGEFLPFDLPVDGLSATATSVNSPRGLAVSPEGDVYVSSEPGQIYRITKTDSSRARLEVPSKDGAELYRFNEYGLHEITLDSVSKNVLYEFDYDESGLLTQIKDGDNNVVVIERDSLGSASAIVAPDNHRTELSVDENGLLSEVLNPMSHRWTMQYTDGGLMKSFKDPNNNVDSFEYNSSGRLIRNDQPNGGQWVIERTREENGYRTELTSGEMLVHGYLTQKDLNGQPTYIDMAPDGTKTERSYTAAETRIVHPDGSQTISQMGPDPRFGLAAPVTIKHQLISASGIVHESTKERTAVLADSQDLLSHTALTETTSINGRLFTSAYDALSSTWTMSSPEGRSVIQINDVNGRPSQIKSAGLAVTQFEYDQRGRLIGLLAGEGAQQRASTWTYNDQGNLASVTDELNRTITFKYDSAARVTEQSSPNGHAIKYQYDANGNLTAITPPGREAHLFSYNGVDHPLDYAPPELANATTITQYQYDLDRRLTQVERPDGRSINLEYNAGGKLATTTIERGTYSYNYDQTTGRLVTIIAPDGGQLSYNYDGFLPLTETWSGDVNGSISRTYDNNFWVREQCVNNSACISFDYDNDGLLVQAGDAHLTRHTDHGLRTGSDLGSLSSEWQYSVFGEIESYVSSFSDDLLVSIDYARDKLGRVTGKVTKIDDQEIVDSYDYDDDGRLTATIRNGVETTWSYDVNGNRTHENGVQIASYDEQDRLLSYRNASFLYTKNGELKQKIEGGASTNLKYDELGNLESVSMPGDVVIDYVIDGQNRRIGKKVNGELVQGFIYADQLNPIAEISADGAILARFVYADKSNVPSYMIKGGIAYSIISDHLGSPRLVVNSQTGEVVQSIDYDVWGNVLSDTNPGFQPFGFAGGLYDLHTGLVRFGARDYDPTTGRWTAKDPIGFNGGDPNLYGYVLGDPLNWIDSDGLARDVIGSKPEAHNGGRPHVHWGKEASPRKNAVYDNGEVRHGDEPSKRMKKLINKKFGWDLKFPWLLLPKEILDGMIGGGCPAGSYWNGCTCVTDLGITI